MKKLAIDGCRDPQVLESLETGWEKVLQKGGLEYIPPQEQPISEGPFQFQFLPHRLQRPVSMGRRTENRGLLTPHQTCPFEEHGVLEIREVLRFSRAERTYHILANKFPVKRHHYLSVRSSDAPLDTLPQCIHSASELEDMLLLCRTIGPPFRFFFNSNSGADGSDSGSSINHWHFQLFPNSGDILEEYTSGSRDVSKQKSAASQTRIKDWNAPHRLYISSDASLLALHLWEDVKKAIELDSAFTLAMAVGESGTLATLFFARSPIKPPKFDGFGQLPAKFGGFELTGAVVIYEHESFKWIQANPGAAVDLAWARLQEGTREI